MSEVLNNDTIQTVCLRSKPRLETTERAKEVFRHSAAVGQVIFLSLSTMSKAERAVNASKESKLHVGLGPQSGHTRKATRDSDLKITKLRAPPTTTNTTPKAGG